MANTAPAARPAGREPKALRHVMAAQTGSARSSGLEVSPRYGHGVPRPARGRPFKSDVRVMAASPSHVAALCHFPTAGRGCALSTAALVLDCRLRASLRVWSPREHPRDSYWFAQVQGAHSTAISGRDERSLHLRPFGHALIARASAMASPLRATSIRPGLHFMALGAANAAATKTSASVRDELLDDAVFQRMEADHHKPAVRVEDVQAGL